MKITYVPLYSPGWYYSLVSEFQAELAQVSGVAVEASPPIPTVKVEIAIPSVFVAVYSPPGTQLSEAEKGMQIADPAKVAGK